MKKDKTMNEKIQIIKAFATSLLYVGVACLGIKFIAFLISSNTFDTFATVWITIFLLLIPAYLIGFYINCKREEKKKKDDNENHEEEY